MTKKMTERLYLKIIYFTLLAIFMLMFLTFNYIENSQKKAIYNFVYKHELAKQKKEIKLETYAALSFIDSYTQSTIEGTFRNLAYNLHFIITNKSMLSRLYSKKSNVINGSKLAIFNDNGTSSVDFLNLKYCKPYNKIIALPFGGISFKICYSHKIKIGNGFSRFLVALSKLPDGNKIGTYESMLNVESKIMEHTFPKLNRFILKNKNRDSYFFIAKILNINGGEHFAMNIYNKSLGIQIGKPTSSKGTDIKGNHYREKYIKALKQFGETYSVYWYPSPTDKKPHLKISFRKYYKPLRWMIGTGFYENRIKQECTIFTNDVFKQLQSFQIFLFIVYLATMVFIYIIGAKFLSMATRDTAKIIRNIPLVGKKENPINIDRIHFERPKIIAKSLNELSKTLIEKNEHIEKNKIDFLKTFVKVVEVRDVYTKGHSERVAIYSKKIANILGLGEEIEHDLYIAGLLHDIGKVAIPDNILLKPDKLSKHEYEIMKFHSEFSYDLIKDVGFFNNIDIFVRQHHERCDGSGYPDGITCDKITIQGRILAIADVFDALTTSRPYRKAFSLEQAIDVIKSIPLDQEIIKKIEPHFKEIYIKDPEQNQVSSILSKVEKNRLDLFEKDSFTGLYRIKSLINFLNILINNNVHFYLFMIDIKQLKKVNYMFGYEKGNDLILEVTELIKNTKYILHPSRIGSNYFAFVYAKDGYIKVKKTLEEKLNSIYIDNYKIEYYISVLSSKNIANGEEIIYLAEKEIEKMKHKDVNL